MIATVFVHQRTAEEAFFPIAVMVHTIPVMAYAPILVLLLGNGLERQGRDRRAHLLLPDPGQHDARPARRQPAANGADAHPFGLAERNLLQARLKCSLPYLFAALKIAAATSVIGAIVGEWIGATTGIGALIIQATYNFDSPLLYATIVVGSAFSAAFFGVISWLESHFLKWNVAQTG